MDLNTKLIALVGPTASGKSALSISLANELNGEIISCDSMQVYRKMNIGTAKPSFEEMCGIPHHLIDVADPDQDFSCADYKVLAEQAIRDVVSRGKTPIFCGGTGLYLDSVVSVSSFSPSIPEGIREELSRLSPDQLWDELVRVDPISADKTHKNNVKRVMRALEIYRGTGRTKSEWDELSKKQSPPYDTLVIGLDYKDRELLYQRIDRRVDMMLDSGLLDEIKSLPRPLSQTAAQAIGYKEMLLYLDGELGYGEAVELLKKNTRNYAKRQLTWFRRNKNTLWLFPDSQDFGENFKNIVNIAKKHLNLPV